MPAQPGQGTEESLPISDHQLLGQTPKDYSAQSLESADKAARGHLITNTIIPPGTGQQLPSDSLEVVGGGAGAGGEVGYMMKAVELTSLWTLKTPAGKAPCPSLSRACHILYHQVPGLKGDWALLLEG